MQHQNIFDQSFKIGTAEKKLFLVFIFYIFQASISLTVFTIGTRNSELFANALQEYFMCEFKGHDPSDPCTHNGTGQVSTPLNVLSIILLGLYPVVQLVFALNISELKELYGSRKKRNKHQLSRSTNLSSCKPVKDLVTSM